MEWSRWRGLLAVGLFVPATALGACTAQDATQDASTAEAPGVPPVAAVAPADEVAVEEEEPITEDWTGAVDAPEVDAAAETPDVAAPAS